MTQTQTPPSPPLLDGERERRETLAELSLERIRQSDLELRGNVDGRRSNYTFPPLIPFWRDRENEKEGNERGNEAPCAFSTRYRQRANELRQKTDSE